MPGQDSVDLLISFKMKNTCFVLFSIVLFFSCKKNESAPINHIVGTWAFKTGFYGKFQSEYGDYLSPGSQYLNATASYSIPSDSVAVTFDAAGNFSFDDVYMVHNTGSYT